MKESYLSKYLHLRLMVGYLGERSQLGWWPTSFYDPSSKLFLEPVFPKTKGLAQYQGVKEAAHRLHDEHTGVGNVFHLFRLPEEVEHDLHTLMQEVRADSELLAGLKSKESAMLALAAVADGTRSAAEGPVAVGKINALFTPSSLKGLAQCYLTAFEQGTRSYPYFSG